MLRELEKPFRRQVGVFATGPAVATVVLVRE
jgi:hypothetical protein